MISQLNSPNLKFKRTQKTSQNDEISQFVSITFRISSLPRSLMVSRSPEVIGREFPARLRLKPIIYRTMYLPRLDHKVTLVPYRPEESEIKSKNIFLWLYYSSHFIDEVSKLIHHNQEYNYSQQSIDHPDEIILLSKPEQ